MSLGFSGVLDPSGFHRMVKNIIQDIFTFLERLQVICGQIIFFMYCILTFLHLLLYSPSRPAAHSWWMPFIFDALQCILSLKADIYLYK